MSYGEIDVVGDEVEIIGDEDYAAALAGLVGDDDDDDGADILGALSLRRQASPQQRQRAQKAVRRLIAEKIAEKGTVVRQKPYTGTRRLQAGFSSLAVAAGATVNVSVEASVPIQPNRLLIPGVIGNNFTLTALNVGLSNHMLTSDSIHCAMFDPMVTGVNEEGSGFYKIGTLPVGQSLNMSFKNISANAADLYGSWLCIALVT